MKLGGLGTGGRDLRSLLEGGTTATLSDGQLLDRFSTGRGDSAAEAAFAALVSRHGPMVWGTCRRILRDPHAAEDAFQATFLLLVKKAASVRVEDSLGRWLHGVGVRVALRARAARSRGFERDPDVAEPTTPPVDPTLADLRAAIDEEVDRLPPRYRAVVVLCHLEGLTRERAAGRLGCPVGTVNSRLSRAGELLKARLTRRGLAPASAALLATLASSEASAAVPPRLAAATVAASARLLSGGTLAGMVPAGVAVLLQESLRRMTMMTLIKATALGTSLIALAAVAVGARGQDPAQGTAPAKGAAPKVAKAVEAPAPPPTPAEQYKAIKAEWDAAIKACWAEVGKAKNKAERDELFGKHYPNELAYFQRCIDLANAHPKDTWSREALLWVIADGMRNSDSIGPRSVPIAKAVEKLLDDFPDDPRVARGALGIANIPSQNRAAFARGLYDQAKSHETKGVAALILAQYLPIEAMFVEMARLMPAQPNQKYSGYDEQGRPETSEGGKAYDDAYWERLTHQDAAAMKRESEDLYKLLIAEYADVAYDPWMSKGTEVVKNPTPKSLADIAQSKLDDLHTLAVGKPAPEIEGVDLDGKPLKLSDFRGKVVAIVFWSSGCGPCLAAVPHERELLEKLKDKPFVILGVNTDEKVEAARKAVGDTKMTWPSWKDGGSGAICERYHIQVFPTTFVIDAAGIIRQKRADGGSLDKFVEEVLAGMETSPKPAGSE